ncbi:alpha/beta fold hydrolase [Halobacillus sp. Marseille-Q1614]|uniref:alpha/beta fold hydrolase n=1 Tax=Halobacillus sp. Marseille-Q1614 TaxID=2709134 RepID=UPI00156D5579|nr:alpha/beta fold hydrolase [Halobacillus sp. Marseille-Q1614]
MKEFYKTSDGCTFHGYEAGDKNLPDLHGMTGDSRSFLGLIDYFKNDFHLIILDLPGHGETEPLKYEEGYRFSSLVKRIFPVIEEMASSPFYILGHSWGGGLSL